MKTTLALLFAVLTFSSIQNSQAKTLIISDIDDTIKMTNVLGSKPTVIFNGLIREKAFSGMRELYQEMGQSDETIIYYVSGSPKIIRSRVADFLDENKFPQQENLILKNGLKDDTFKYKTENIRSLITKLSPDKVILIGDDTEFDPEIYAGIYAEYPSLVDGIYIRSIQNREVPPGTHKFFSPLEIGGNEILKGNLLESSLKKVTHGFIKQTNNSGIAIKGRYCPRDGRAELEELKEKFLSEETIELLTKTQDKIKSSCR